MLTTQFLAHILDALKKWLPRLARRCGGLLFLFLSLLRHRFAAGHSKLEDWGLITCTPSRLSSGLSQLQGGIARGNEPIFCSLLPVSTGETGQEDSEELSSPSDHPYLRTFSQRPRSGTMSTISSLGDMPSLHLRDLGGAHSAPPSLVHVSPDLSGGRMSVGTYRSFITRRSIGGSQSRQAAYRRHTGPVHSRPVSGVSDPGNNHSIIFTSPILPGNGQQVGLEAVLRDGPQIAAMVANEVRRYERYNPRVVNASKIIIPAMTVTFPANDSAVPQGWTRLVHPEGARYFVNETNRTFTEMNICDEEICEDIGYYMEYLLARLQQKIEHRNLELDMQKVDLVIEPKSSNDSTVVCCYYFANHRDKCLFWLDDCIPEDILSDCKGVESLSHTGLAIQGQYWCVLAKPKTSRLCKETDMQCRKHWQYFPSLCPVEQCLIDEVKYMLIRATCDHLNSRYSVAPFDVIELRDYISIMDKINVNFPVDDGAQQYLSHVATILGRNHFVNLHGEDQVRLTFEQTAHLYTPSLLIIVLAPLLFFEPMSQVRELHQTFVDAMPSSERRNAFNLKLNGQLQDSNLLATVLLNANVGFLAINSVDVGGRSPIQIASYMSLVASLGSMVIGLLLSHKRTMDRSNTQARISLSGGLETLAIIHSLPKALLLWGMVFFFVAFSIDWASRGDIYSRVIVGSVILVTLLMILYGIARTRNAVYWRQVINWLHADVHPGLLSRVVDTRKQFMVFMGMRRGQINPTCEPRSDTEGVRLAPMGVPAVSSQVNAEADAPMLHTPHLSSSQPERPLPDHHENNTSSPTGPDQSTAFVDPPPPLHVNNLQPSNSHTNTGILTSEASLQQIREDSLTIPQHQSTAEAGCEFDHAPLDMDITTSPLQESFVESATAKRTLRDGHDIEECKD